MKPAGMQFTRQQIPALLFTRQQVGELTGTDDSTLSYWTREGLLTSIAGGGGRGKHHRFDFTQVTLAGILNEIRTRTGGADLASLKSLAQTFKRSQDYVTGLGLTWDQFHSLSTMHQAYELMIRREGSVKNITRVRITGPLRPPEDIEILDEVWRTEIVPRFKDKDEIVRRYALELPREEVHRHWFNNRILRRVPAPTPDETPEERAERAFPIFFVQMDAGDWIITERAAELPVEVLSYIAIDCDRLSGRIWSGFD